MNNIIDRYEAAIYLAAMIDAEGWVQKFDFAKKRNGTYAVRIFNTEKNIIEKITESLDILKIDYASYTTERPPYKILTTVNICGRKKLVKLLSLVAPYMAHEDKIKRLQGLVNNIGNNKKYICAKGHEKEYGKSCKICKRLYMKKYRLKNRSVA